MIFCRLDVADRVEHDGIVHGLHDTVAASCADRQEERMDRSSCVRMTPMLVLIALASIAAGCRGDLAPDMPPTVEISVPAEGIAGADVLASLTVADDGILERVVIGWGDATADTIRPAVAAIAMELVHRYGETGSFTVTATAVDDDGSIVSANGSITINHP